MDTNTVTQLPDDPSQAVGLIIQLKPDATPGIINIYGTGQYVIGTSTANTDIPGIMPEELLRVFPAEEYGKPDARAHGLLWGKGVYKRLRNLFCVVTTTPQL